MIGWGILLWQLTTRVYASAPELGRNMVLTSMATWFVIECLASIAAGLPLNAVFNIGFLLLFVVPFWRPVEAAHV